ncbi:DUF4328 domain-containing protein [Streptomyces sp. NPDC053541]|uniref:DUF4328 domain-containing protein n=1 Tax=Streptomyces sp. NPDC053541 TaxID=3365709 RepID=UPI0037CFE2E4
MDSHSMPVGPAAATGPRYHFRDPRGAALVAQCFLACSAIADVYVIATGGAESPWVKEDEILLAAWLQLACWFSFLFWFYRCRRNAEAIAPGSHKWTPAFALGAWIIPLAMWWVPRRIALDIHRAGGPPRDAWLINAWWCVWLVDGPVSVAVHLLILHQTDYHTPVDHALAILDSILAIAVIRRVTAGQAAGPLPYVTMT